MSLGGMLIIDDTQLYKSTLAIGRINRGSDTGYLFSQDSTDFLNFNLGYQFDLYWYDIPLGSFDVGLGFDIYKNKNNWIIRERSETLCCLDKFTGSF